jgi:hypothetical protein
MLHEEFERQVENLIAKGYPELVSLTAAEFTQELEPLKHKISEMNLNPIESNFQPIEGKELPEGRAYLLLDIDTGS